MRFLALLLLSGTGLFHRYLTVPSNVLHDFAQPRETPTENFIEFWKAFRIAALKFDTLQLERFCRFPVQYRGPLDDDPIVEVNREEFLRVFRLFLHQWNGRNIAGSRELDLIEQSTQPDSQPVKGRMHIGDMVFLQVNGKWKLTFLYMNDETIELLNNSARRIT